MKVYQSPFALASQTETETLDALITAQENSRQSSAFCGDSSIMAESIISQGDPVLIPQPVTKVAHSTNETVQITMHKPYVKPDTRKERMQ
jgi:hypothetical protein